MALWFVKWYASRLYTVPFNDRQDAIVIEHLIKEICIRRDCMLYIWVCYLLIAV